MVTEKDLSILKINPATGKLSDLPLKLRCRIAREHRFCCWCRDLAAIVVIMLLAGVAGGFE